MLREVENSHGINNEVEIGKDAEMIDFRNAGKVLDRKRGGRGKKAKLFAATVILLAAIFGTVVGLRIYDERRSQQIETAKDSEEPKSSLDLTTQAQKAEQADGLKADFDESKPTGIWTQALKAAENEDYEKAISLIDNLLTQYPDSKLYGESLAKKNAWQKTIENIRKLDLKIDSLLAQSETLKTEGLLDKSLDCIADILKLDPGNAKAKQLRSELTVLIGRQKRQVEIETLFAQSRTFRSEGSLDKSLACMAEVLQLDPENSKAKQLQSELTKLINKQKIEGKIETSFRTLTKTASAYEAEEEWSKAIDAYNQAIAIKPNDQETRNRLLTCQHNLHFEEAQGAVSKNDLDGAVKSYLKALSYKQVASTQLSLESVQKALQERQTTEHRKQEVVVWKNKAMTSEKKGDLSTALEFYQKAQESADDKSLLIKIDSLKDQIEEQQKREKYDNLLSHARAKNDRAGAKEALETLEEALTLYPDSSEALELRTEVRSILPPAVNFNQGLILRGHKGWVTSASFSPDGNRIVSGSADNTVKIWDAKTGECLRTLHGHNYTISVVAFSPDGEQIASGDRWGHTLKIWDVKTGACLYTIEGHSGDIHDLCFSPDSRLVATAGDDKLIKIWDVKARSYVRTLKGHSNGVFCVGFSPDGKTIASGSWDKTIRIWETATGKCVRTLRGHRATVESLAFSPDGTKIVSCDFWDEKMNIWRVSTGALLSTVKDDFLGFRSVTFSPYGNCIVSGDADGKIRIWDPVTNMCLKSIKAHRAFPNYIESVDFSPDGKHILSTGYDRCIKVCSLK